MELHSDGSLLLGKAGTEPIVISASNPGSESFDCLSYLGHGFNKLRSSWTPSSAPWLAKAARSGSASALLMTGSVLL